MNFRLREGDLRDGSDLARVINNRRIQANLRDGIPYPYTASDGVAFLQSVLDAPADSQYVRLIEVDGRVAGCIGVYRKENIHRLTAELGYYLAEEHWGKGIVTGAVAEFCGWIFANTDIVRIFAEPFATNRASCRVLEKAGFRHEGTLRKNCIKDGVILDMELYARVR